MMGNTYRIVDLRTDTTDVTETTIQSASSPEQAASQVLGIEVMRSGAKKSLVARVYWQIQPGPMNMVRLYAKATG